MRKFRKYLILAISFIVIVGLDMLTKVITEGKNLPFIPGFVGIVSVHNTGAAFSMFSNHTTMLSIFTTIFIIAIIIFYIMINRKNIIFEIGMSFIISGAIGNLADRLIFGYVRDFINLEFMDFAIFNIADCALTIGIIILMVYIIFFSDLQSKQEKAGKQ